MDPWALRIRGLEVRAPSGAIILTDISWQLGAGRRGVLVGASGSGKSRLLRIFNRLDEPSRGDIHILGRPLGDWPVAELRHSVGWVPQRPSLMDGTARDCLDVVRRLELAPAPGAPDMDQAVTMVGLDAEVLGRDTAQLSGGERHRLAIARALLLGPRMLLLDEPTSALDGAGAARLLDHLMAWQEDNRATLVVVTHRIEDARALGGDMLVLARGRVVRQGPTRELIERAQGFDVAELLTGRRSGPAGEVQP